MTYQENMILISFIKGNYNKTQKIIQSYIPCAPTANTKLKMISLDIKAGFMFIAIMYKAIHCNAI